MQTNVALLTSITISWFLHQKSTHISTKPALPLTDNSTDRGKRHLPACSLRQRFNVFWFTSATVLGAFAGLGLWQGMTRAHRSVSLERVPVRCLAHQCCKSVWNSLLSYGSVFSRQQGELFPVTLLAAVRLGFPTQGFSPKSDNLYHCENILCFLGWKKTMKYLELHNHIMGGFCCFLLVWVFFPLHSIHTI